MFVYVTTPVTSGDISASSRQGGKYRATVSGVVVGRDAAPRDVTARGARLEWRVRPPLPPRVVAPSESQLHQRGDVSTPWTADQDARPQFNRRDVDRSDNLTRLL